MGDLTTLNGRSTFNQATANRIVELVKVGNYPKQAALSAGVNESTWEGWMNRALRVRSEVEGELADLDLSMVGEELDYEMVCSLIGQIPRLDYECFALRQAIDQAEAEAEVYAVTTLRKAMGSSWQAALAYLERKHAGRWRKRDQHEIIAVGGETTPEEEALLGAEPQKHITEALRAARNTIEGTARELEAPPQGGAPVPPTPT